MASEKDVLRVLVEEARARGVHPDSARVLDEWSEANQQVDASEDTDNSEDTDDTDSRERRPTAPSRATGRNR